MDGLWATKSEGYRGTVQLVSKISNLCDPDPPTLQTDRQTDRRTDGRHAISIPRYALVHRAVKITNFSCDPTRFVAPSAVNQRPCRPNMTSLTAAAARLRPQHCHDCLLRVSMQHSPLDHCTRTSLARPTIGDRAFPADVGVHFPCSIVITVR